MARIAWGIMGDSRGHLTRALIFLRELAGHEFLFVGGGCVSELADQGLRVHQVPVPGTLLAGGRVRCLATAAHFLRVAAGAPATLATLRRTLEDFQPDLAVSDYEFFLPRAARALGLPCLGLGHVHLLTKCRLDPPPGQTINRLATTVPMRLFFSRPSRYLVTSFFRPPPLRPDTEVVGPLLRHDIHEHAPRPGEHVLAYLRTGLPESLARALEATNREVRIYGLGERPDRGRLRFLPSAREPFLDDLAGCRWVLSNAGHNLLSEALHLGKPVLAMPSGMLYEQYLNAWHLRAMGRGDFFLDPARADQALAAFEHGLERFEAAANPLELGNARAVEAISELLGNAPSREDRHAS